jgi:hypothetical protein
MHYIDIKRRMNSGNAYYYSVQKISSSRLLSKNVKIRMFQSIVLHVVLYVCQICSLTRREGH